MPLARVARLLREEEGEGTLVAFVAFTAAVAYRANPSTIVGHTDPEATGGSGTGQES